MRGEVGRKTPKKEMDNRRIEQTLSDIVTINIPMEVKIFWPIRASLT